jgi:hypothetical protein
MNLYLLYEPGDYRAGKVIAADCEEEAWECLGAGWFRRDDFFCILLGTAVEGTPKGILYHVTEGGLDPKMSK